MNTTMNTTEISSPLCACGCGEMVKMKRNGKPNKFIRNHNLRGVPKSVEHRMKLSEAKKGKPGNWLGKKIPESARLKMSIAKKGKRLSVEHRAKISETMTGKPHPSIHHKQSWETRRKKSESQRGEKSAAWKGGISKDNALARSSFEFRAWRLEVLKRDHYTCQKCGAKHQKGSRPILHAHHIKSFAQFPELRYDVNNGLTLCKPCHDQIHGRSK